MSSKYGKNGIPKKRRATGVVYILQITLEGHVVYKIGQTTRRVYERVAELSVDLYKWYGYFPRINVLKSDRHKHYIEIEAELLKRSKQWQFECEFKLDGVTEYRKDCGKIQLIEWYNELAKKVDWEHSNAKNIVVEEFNMNELSPMNIDI